ncbi:hypothetical protein NUW54_g4254 [Trametes sanguinea]|uniref:Uncharacterized protein n=1 Tax=Trametes sanguinea TaxID=158606 RepID=A0ACC1PZP9_9APHY|nr:hypothetical protein NUW54_g4254 [Trametes sanguinea]
MTRGEGARRHPPRPRGPECRCGARYRPAYELQDGALERAGRAGGVAAAWAWSWPAIAAAATTLAGA